MAAEKKNKVDFSMLLMVLLLWVVTIVGFILAFRCVTNDHIESLPWVAVMTCFPWASFVLRSVITKNRKAKKPDYSKQLVTDIRSLLWVVTVGGLLLAFYCIKQGYTGSLPWVSAMVGLPWSAHGLVCSVYLGMAKSGTATERCVCGVTREVILPPKGHTNTLSFTITFASPPTDV